MGGGGVRGGGRVEAGGFEGADAEAPVKEQSAELGHCLWGGTFASCMGRTRGPNG